MQKNNLINTFLIAFFLIVSWPILSTGPKSAFFNLDPDVHYLSSAFSNIKQGVISYTDHPGTPTIFYLSAVLTPFRFIAKFIDNVSFSTWTFLHFHFLYYFLRLAQTLLLTLGVGLFLKSIYRTSNSYLITIFSLLCLLSYSVFPNFGITIGPEVMSFFIISIWLYVFTLYLQTGFPGYLTILSLIAGIAVGNKFSNLSLIASSVALTVVHAEFSRRQRVLNTFISTGLSISGFLIATWAIRGAYPRLFEWVYLLATKTQIHGNGKTAIFDFNSYLNSFVSLISLETFASKLVGLTIVVVIYSFFKKTLSRPLGTAFITTMLTTLVFAKYPLSHYQLANYAVFITIASILLSKLKLKLIIVGIISLLLISSYLNIKNYYRYTFNAITETATFEKYFSSHPPQKATVLEWSRSYEYALIWTRAWGSGYLSDEIVKYMPTLLELKFPDKIVKDYGQTTALLDVCWDQLYIQKVSYPDFFLANPNLKFTIVNIPEINSHFLLHSKHCL